MLDNDHKTRQMTASCFMISLVWRKKIIVYVTPLMNLIWRRLWRMNKGRQLHYTKWVSQMWIEPEKSWLKSALGGGDLHFVQHTFIVRKCITNQLVCNGARMNRCFQFINPTKRTEPWMSQILMMIMFQSNKWQVAGILYREQYYYCN